MASKTDKGNAQLRSTKRNSPNAETTEALRIMQDPAFVRGFDRYRDAILGQLENPKNYDGSPESASYLLEQSRQLMMLKTVKHHISSGLQMQQLRIEKFKPKSPSKDDG